MAKSTDGGATWTISTGPAGGFLGKRIVNVVPTTLGSPAGSVVLAASFFEEGGVYRSTDGGVTWTRISGGGTLPNTGVSNLVGDLSNPNRFYASITSAETGTVANQGIWISNDGGVTWAQTPTVFPAVANSYRILLSVNASAGVLWAMVISSSTFQASGVYYTSDQGHTWLGGQVPSPSIHPAQQGLIHGAIVASPTDATVAFVSGDRQNSPFRNVNGCNNYSGNVFEAVQSGGPVVFTNVVCNGANGTSPHADSRGMVFDGNGNLWQVNDGGVYRLSNPTTSARVWSSLDTTVQTAEFDSVSYDPLSNIVFDGSQDIGSAYQSGSGSQTWFTLSQGDGGYTAIDADQTVHPGNSIRYSTYTFLQNLVRVTFDNLNNFLSYHYLAENITAGPGAGLNLLSYDNTIAFYNPYVLNNINKSRMLIGTATIYESMNQGDSLTNLGGTPGTAPWNLQINSLSYGSRMSDGTPKPDAFYVAAGNKLYFRLNLGDVLTTINSPSGQFIRSVVMDPQNYLKVYIVTAPSATGADSNTHIFMSTDGGSTWTDITFSLLTMSNDIRTIEVYSPDAGIRNTRLLVGGLGGVFILRRPGAAGIDWALGGSNLPHGLITTVKYDYTNQVLLAGYLGRGAWTVNNPFGVAVAAIPITPAAQAPVPIYSLPGAPEKRSGKR